MSQSNDAVSNIRFIGKEEMKQKLDTIWHDVQTNLPEINFDENNHDDNLDILGIVFRRLMF